MIYFDNAATTPLSETLIPAISSSHAEFGFNPSSAHFAGKLAKTALNHARRAIAKLFGCDPTGVYFTHGATEATNIIMQGYANHVAETDPTRNEIVISAIEHPAVFTTAQALSERGWQVRLAQVDGQGSITTEELSRLITPKTAMVCIMAVNNETGAIQDINALAHVVKMADPSILFMTDFVQAAGKVPLTIDFSVVDAFVFTGHKIGAPKGTGAFYLNPDFRIRPILFGGGQEGGYRPGTTDPIGAKLLALAVEEAFTDLERRWSTVRSLNQHLLEELQRAGISFLPLVEAVKASPYILSIAFPGNRATTLVDSFSERGVCIASGSACSSSSQNRSRVLQSMKIPVEQIDATVRVSFSWRNTASEIDEFVKVAKSLLRSKHRAARSDTQGVSP